MGGGTKVKETSNSTQQVQLPAWMTEAGQNLWNQANTAASANPITAYGGQIAPGMTQNMTAANQVAANGANAGQGDIAAARGLNLAGGTGQVDQMTAGNFNQAAAQRYMDPFLGEVQSRTLGEMGRQNQMARQDLGDSAGAAKSFGGTRHAVLEGEQAKGQNANMLDYLARSNSEAYGNAQQQFERDRAADMAAQGTNIASQSDFYRRLMDAAGQSAAIGGQDAALRSNSIMDLLRTGGAEQDTQAGQLGAAYQEFLRMQDAPMERYRDLGAILAGTPRNVTTTSNGTSTTQQRNGWLSSVMGAASIGASMFSDRRLKRDIELVDRRADGIGIYAFRYLWDETKRHVGVMADEVAKLAPYALGPRVFGFFTVNYSKLGMAA
jgi:hypothetical protein